MSTNSWNFPCPPLVPYKFSFNQVCMNGQQASLEASTMTTNNLHNQYMHLLVQTTLGVS